MYIISIHESDGSLKKNDIMLNKGEYFAEAAPNAETLGKRKTWKPPPHQMRQLKIKRSSVEVVAVAD